MSTFLWNNFSLHCKPEKMRFVLEKQPENPACTLNSCTVKYIKLPDREKWLGPPYPLQDKNDDLKFRARKRNTFIFVAFA